MGQSKEAPIQYTIDLAESRNHYIKVSLTFEATAKESELMMPVWTPGSYLIREYARHIDSIEASVDGKTTEIIKVKKNRWRLATKVGKKVIVEYRLYCNEMSVRTNFVDQQYAVLNGAPTFLTLPDQLDQPHQVSLKLPKNWNRSATSLRAVGDNPHQFIANDFDELVDSPIVAGNIDVYPFEVDGVAHQLVNIGESGHWQGAKAAADLKKVVEAHQKMWGNTPYDRYLFLNVICERGGGLEHDNSTLIMTSRWSFRDSRRYVDWLSLASHEFFHTWNVRRLRPESLVEYDYENEVYTSSLWIAEGITSYYEDLLLVRAGLISDADFLARMSKNLESTQRAEGRKVQSLSESSFDTWIKFYRPDENSSNTRISYYSKGAVVAMLLDAEIRVATNGEKSLDDVMREMYSRHLEKGFRPADFRATVDSVTGEDFSDWFARHIDSAQEVDLAVLKKMGVDIPEVPANHSEETEDTGDKADRPKTTKQTAWLGVSTSSNNGRLTISRIQSNSPATDAGLNTDDEIIAVNGFRVYDNFGTRLKQYSVGDEIEILISRRGEILKMPIVIAGQPNQSWKFRLQPKPRWKAKKLREGWLK